MPIDLFGRDWQYCIKEECQIYSNPIQYQRIFIFEFGVLIFQNIHQTKEKDIIDKVNKYSWKQNDNQERDQLILSKIVVESPRLVNNTIFLTADDLDELLAPIYAFA